MGSSERNQNGDSGTHARSAPQAPVKLGRPQKNIQHLSPLQIAREFRTASDIRRLAHALFQEAACRFSMFAMEMGIVNLRSNGLKMAVSRGQKVSAAEIALLKQSNGGFGTPLGGAFEGHFDSPCKTGSTSQAEQ